MAIQEHDLEIRHHSGRSNASADTLSRNPVVESGNRYVVVFLDYTSLNGSKLLLSRPCTVQRCTTITKLLVEEIFGRHGAPEHLLSDRGANFLSDLMYTRSSYADFCQ